MPPRSAARACPATSRPRAKVSFDGDSRRRVSSITRRRATTLKSALGISRPTTLLPGMGASMRRVRAARAMARSSWTASMRATLIEGSGSTSYCVTTGPAFQRVTRAGMSKAASLATMISALRAWSIFPPATPGASTSRMPTGGRRYSGMAARPSVGDAPRGGVPSLGPPFGAGDRSTCGGAGGGTTMGLGIGTAGDGPIVPPIAVACAGSHSVPEALGAVARPRRVASAAVGPWAASSSSTAGSPRATRPMTRAHHAATARNRSPSCMFASSNTPATRRPMRTTPAATPPSGPASVRLSVWPSTPPAERRARPSAPGAARSRSVSPRAAA